MLGKEILQVEAVCRGHPVLATQLQCLHQHQVYSTWTTSMDACQQAMEL